MPKRKKLIITIVIIVFIITLICVAFLLINNSMKRKVSEVKWLADERYNFVTFATQEEAINKANDIGCTGFHTHEQEGETIFMACEQHSDLDPFVLESTEREQSGGLY